VAALPDRPAAPCIRLLRLEKVEPTFPMRRLTTVTAGTSEATPIRVRSSFVSS